MPRIGLLQQLHQSEEGLDEGEHNNNNNPNPSSSSSPPAGNNKNNNQDFAGEKTTMILGGQHHHATFLAGDNNNNPSSSGVGAGTGTTGFDVQTQVTKLLECNQTFNIPGVSYTAAGTLSSASGSGSGGNTSSPSSPTVGFSSSSSNPSSPSNHRDPFPKSPNSMMQQQHQKFPGGNQSFYGNNSSSSGPGNNTNLNNNNNNINTNNIFGDSPAGSLERDPGNPNNNNNNQLVSASSSSSSSAACGINCATASAEELAVLFERVQSVRVKTSHVVVIASLHDGLDPRTIMEGGGGGGGGTISQRERVHTARLECWRDPLEFDTHASGGTGTMASGVAAAIAEQYRGIAGASAQNLVFHQFCDSTDHDVERGLLNVRRRADESRSSLDSQSRIVVHYNGHGMISSPEGDLFFPNVTNTHFVPMSLSHFANVAGAPALYVFDCDRAGGFAKYFHKHLASAPRHSRDILLCACSSSEDLPRNPGYPMDLFTSCLTTPLRTLLLWSAHNNSLLGHIAQQQVENNNSGNNNNSSNNSSSSSSAQAAAAAYARFQEHQQNSYQQQQQYHHHHHHHQGKSSQRGGRKTFVGGDNNNNNLFGGGGGNSSGNNNDRPFLERAYMDIPGSIGDRRTPLGELQLILTALVDMIAWSCVAPEKFYTYFRQDTLTRHLVRNFLLADRILREFGRHPVSYPPIAPEARQHPLWGLWDVVLDGVLCQLPTIQNDPSQYRHSSFFPDQLTAFATWLEVGETTESNAEQLPCVMFALQKPTHYRDRALLLLGKYFETGKTAVFRGLACGALQYLSTFAKSSYYGPNLLLLNAWHQLLRVLPKIVLDPNEQHLLLSILKLHPETCRLIIVSPDGEEPYETTAIKQEQQQQQQILLASGGGSGSSSSSSSSGSQQNQSAAVTNSNYYQQQLTISSSDSLLSDGTLSNSNSPSFMSLSGPSSSKLMNNRPSSQQQQQQQSGTSASAASGGDSKKSSSSSSSTTRSKPVLTSASLTLSRGRAYAAHMLCTLLSYGKVSQEDISLSESSNYNASLAAGASSSSTSSSNSSSTATNQGSPQQGNQQQAQKFAPLNNQQQQQSRGAALNNNNNNNNNNNSNNALGGGLKKGGASGGFNLYGGSNATSSPSGAAGSSSSSASFLHQQQHPFTHTSESNAEATAQSFWSLRLFTVTYPLLSHEDEQLRSWGCLLMGCLLSHLPQAREQLVAELIVRTDEVFFPLLEDTSPSVRASAVFLLTKLVGTSRLDLMDTEACGRRVFLDRLIMLRLFESFAEVSRLVRREILFGAIAVLFHYGSLLTDLIPKKQAAQMFMDAQQKAQQSQQQNNQQQQQQQQQQKKNASNNNNTNSSSSSPYASYLQTNPNQMSEEQYKRCAFLFVSADTQTRLPPSAGFSGTVASSLTASGTRRPITDIDLPPSASPSNKSPSSTSPVLVTPPNSTGVSSSSGSGGNNNTSSPQVTSSSGSSSSQQQQQAPQGHFPSPNTWNNNNNSNQQQQQQQQSYMVSPQTAISPSTSDSHSHSHHHQQGVPNSKENLTAGLSEILLRDLKDVVWDAAVLLARARASPDPQISELAQRLTSRMICGDGHRVLPRSTRARLAGTGLLEATTESAFTNSEAVRQRNHRNEDLARLALFHAEETSTAFSNSAVAASQKMKKSSSSQQQQQNSSSSAPGSPSSTSAAAATGKSTTSSSSPTGNQFPSSSTSSGPNSKKEPLTPQQQLQLNQQGVISSALSASVANAAEAETLVEVSSFPTFSSLGINNVKAGSFRLLEPQIFVADGDRRFHVINYDRVDEPIKLFSLNHSFSIQSLHIVNDLAPNVAALIVSTNGTVTLYGGFFATSSMTGHGYFSNNNNNSNTRRGSSSSSSHSRSSRSHHHHHHHAPSSFSYSHPSCMQGVAPLLSFDSSAAFRGGASDLLQESDYLNFNSNLSGFQNKGGLFNSFLPTAFRQRDGLFCISPILNKLQCVNLQEEKTSQILQLGCDSHCSVVRPDERSQKLYCGFADGTVRMYDQRAGGVGAGAAGGGNRGNSSSSGWSSVGAGAGGGSSISPASSSTSSSSSSSSSTGGAKSSLAKYSNLMLMYVLDSGNTSYAHSAATSKSQQQQRNPINSGADNVVCTYPQDKQPTAIQSLHTSNNNDNQLISISSSGGVQLWDLRKRNCVLQIYDDPNFVARGALTSSSSSSSGVPNSSPSSSSSSSSANFAASSASASGGNEQSGGAGSVSFISSGNSSSSSSSLQSGVGSLFTGSLSQKQEVVCSCRGNGVVELMRLDCQNALRQQQQQSSSLSADSNNSNSSSSPPYHFLGSVSPASVFGQSALSSSSSTSSSGSGSRSNLFANATIITHPIKPFFAIGGSLVCATNSKQRLKVTTMAM